MSPTARTWLKRAFVGTGCILVAGAGVLGVEIYHAMSQDYLPTSPALEIGGTFGRAGATPLRLTVLGDSTAAGVGAGSADRAYPTLLAEGLATRGWRVDLVGLGVSGARVADLATEQVRRAIDTEPDVVFIGIGANDATHLTSLGDVERDMAAALDELRERTSAAIVVAGAPDMRAAAFLEPLRSIVGWRGRKVAAVIEDAAREREIPVVPLAERTGRYFVSDPEENYSSDDFHPSAAGYARWAEAILPELVAAARGIGS
ncbi:MAG TPA: SGNH/GDSL hydrolase family protein [Actinomycetota bacterium]|jgi:lysophospholipase L1-like esterase